MIHYRPVTLEDYEQVRELLQACEVRGMLLEESRLRRMIDNADRTVGAFDGEHLVGFASALCDEAFFGSVGAACVHPGSRRTGIGTELITQLIEDSPEITWLLRPESEPSAFWQKQGFAPSINGMEKLRDR